MPRKIPRRDSDSRPGDESSRSREGGNPTHRAPEIASPPLPAPGPTRERFRGRASRRSSRWRSPRASGTCGRPARRAGSPRALGSPAPSAWLGEGPGEIAAARAPDSVRTRCNPRRADGRARAPPRPAPRRSPGHSSGPGPGGGTGRPDARARPDLPARGPWLRPPRASLRVRKLRDLVGPGGIWKTTKIRDVTVRVATIL